MFRRLLVATDFGETAAAACNDAVRLAGLFDAELDLIHVEPIRSGASPGGVTEARASLERTRELLGARGARVGEVLVPRGSPAEAILHAAESLAADLIVIAAGDRSRLERGTGPTAETVARFAPMPVWITRHETRFERVLVAADRSEASRDALRVGRELCARTQARLTVAHVLANHDEGPSPTDAEQPRLDELASYLGLEPELRLHAGRGRPSEVLTELARRDGSDVLVLGRVGLGGLRRVFMGATAERLLRRSPCSLLLTSPAPSS